ncbi:MAG: TRAFs-binding domain-containing protein, partial [Cyanobacteria bacterium J06636_28]
MSDTPQPLDTSNIALTADQLKLAEAIAQNLQPQWSHDPFNLGWSTGEASDSTALLHRDWVPYSGLPERSRQQQRSAIHTILKLSLALGYHIDKLPVATAQPAIAAEAPDITFILDALKEPSDLNLTTLLTLQRETIRLKPRTPEVYRALGESILQLGEPLVAYDVLAEGLKHWPTDLRLRQLLALALARSGSTVAANTLLNTLVEDGHQDEETIGLLARTHKDLWTQATDPALEEEHLRLAALRYYQAYDLTGSTWVGINAATMACLMNQTEQAKRLARNIQAKCLTRLHDSAKAAADPYWSLATLGEAALILGELAAAEDFYSQAVENGQGRFGDFSSS